MKDLDIEFYRPYEKVVDTAEGIHFPKWCVNGQMNIAHNCLDKWQKRPEREKTAVLWVGEDGRKYGTISYRELFEAVNRVRQRPSRASGVGKGDRVALFMPMRPELVIAFLAVH